MNKRRQRFRAKADNAFTAKTGVKVVKLTGNANCWICELDKIYRVPVTKLSYAIHNNWQSYEMAVTAKRMKGLRVKQTCGVDQCVNPEHLIGKEREQDGSW